VKPIAISGTPPAKPVRQRPLHDLPDREPANHAASVSCAVPGAVWNVASTEGNAGKYMSVAAGPTAMK
jgi:hypothetical protein